MPWNPRKIQPQGLTIQGTLMCQMIGNAVHVPETILAFSAIFCSAEKVPEGHHPRGTTVVRGLCRGLFEGSAGGLRGSAGLSEGSDPILLTLGNCWNRNAAGLEPRPKYGPYPQYGWDFPAIPEKFRKDPGKVLRAFPGIPLESTAGIPQTL